LKLEVGYSKFKLESLKFFLEEMKKKEDERNMKEFLFYAEAFIQQWATLCGPKLGKDKKAEGRFKDTVLYAEIVKETENFDIPKRRERIRKIMDSVFDQLKSRKEFEEIPEKLEKLLEKLKKIRNKMVHEYIKNVGMTIPDELRVEDSVSLEVKDPHGKTVSSMSYETPRNSKKGTFNNKSTPKFSIKDIDVVTCKRGLEFAEEFVKKCKEEVEKILIEK